MSEPGQVFEPLRAIRQRYSWVWRSGYPFLLAPRPSAIERLRHFGLAAREARRSPPRRVLALVAMTIGFTLASFANAVAAAMADRAAGATGGLATARRAAFYLRAAVRHNAVQPAFRRACHAAGHTMAVAQDMLYDGDAAIWRALNARGGADGEDVQNKARFAAILAGHGLPAVPVLAGFDNGTTVVPAREPSRWGDLFVKPLRGWQGEGAAAWRRTEDGGYQAACGRCDSVASLLDALSGGSWLVQPLLTDGAVLAKAGSEGLSSLRIVTFRKPDGTVGIAAAQLLLAKGGISQEGVIFDVDLSNGRLTAWLDPASRLAQPASGATTLESVPEWDRVAQLARTAHALAFTRFATLGWDLVLTDEGPQILEANQHWGMVPHQLSGTPLGRTGLGPAAIAWLDAIGAGRPAIDG